MRCQLEQFNLYGFIWIVVCRCNTLVESTQYKPPNFSRVVNKSNFSPHLMRVIGPCFQWRHGLANESLGILTVGRCKSSKNVDEYVSQKKSGWYRRIYTVNTQGLGHCSACVPITNPSPTTPWWLPPSDRNERHGGYCHHLRLTFCGF